MEENLNRKLKELDLTLDDLSPYLVDVKKGSHYEVYQFATESSQTFITLPPIYSNFHQRVVKLWDILNDGPYDKMLDKDLILRSRYLKKFCSKYNDDTYILEVIKQNESKSLKLDSNVSRKIDMLLSEYDFGLNWIYGKIISHTQKSSLRTPEELVELGQEVQEDKVCLTFQTFEDKEGKIYIPEYEYITNQDDFKIGMIVQINGDFDLTEWKETYTIKEFSEVIPISSTTTYEEICLHYADEIKKFGSLPDNWDEEGSRGIDNKIVLETMLFLSKLKTEFEKNNLEFTYPEIGPGDGDLGLEWTTEKYKMDIDIDSYSQEIAVVAWTPDRAKKYFKKWNRNQIDPEFLEWMKEVLS